MKTQYLHNKAAFDTKKVNENENLRKKLIFSTDISIRSVGSRLPAYLTTTNRGQLSPNQKEKRMNTILTAEQAREKAKKTDLAKVRLDSLLFGVEAAINYASKRGELSASYTIRPEEADLYGQLYRELIDGGYIVQGPAINKVKATGMQEIVISWAAESSNEE